MFKESLFNRIEKKTNIKKETIPIPDFKAHV